MPRFIANRYDPRDDSSPSAPDYYAVEGPDAPADNPGFYPSETLLLVVADLDGEMCKCGCENRPVGKDSNFCMGHDIRLRGKLIRAHLMGMEVVRAGGGGLISGSAMGFAEEFGWGHYLNDAFQRQIEAVKSSLERANKAVLADATGPQVGDRKLIKVGRWEYTGEVAAVYDDGDTIVYDYVTKNGERKTHTVKKAQ